MAPNPVKFFNWFSLERILTAVARDPPETVDEYLAWLRTIHFMFLTINSVFRTSSNLLNFLPRSQLGETSYKTFLELRTIVDEVLANFPQEEVAKLRELLEETAVPIPAPE